MSTQAWVTPPSPPQKTWIFPQFSENFFSRHSPATSSVSALYLAFPRCVPPFTPTYKAFHYHMRPYHPVIGPLWDPFMPWSGPFFRDRVRLPPGSSPSQGVWGWSVPALMLSERQLSAEQMAYCCKLWAHEMQNCCWSRQLHHAAQQTSSDLDWPWSWTWRCSEVREGWRPTALGYVPPSAPDTQTHNKILLSARVASALSVHVCICVSVRLHLLST